jgi:hypothetical protein
MGEWFSEVAAVLLSSLERMWWIIALGIALSAALKTWKLDKRLRALISRAGGWGIPVAVATGIISPLCSCGILPVVVSLMAVEVPFPVVMALLITSPLMSPDAFVITAGQLGPAYAWAKLIAAAVIGLAAGYVTHLVHPGPMPIPASVDDIHDADHHCVDPAKTDDPRRGLTVPIPRWRYFLLMVGDVGGLMVRLLAFALILEAVLIVSVPQAWITSLLGVASPLAVPLAVLIGLPIPLHQVAAVPILYGLLDRGMAPGAAMALLIAGPVASLPAFWLLSRVVDRRAIVIYLSVGIGGAIAAGYLFSLVMRLGNA